MANENILPDSRLLDSDFGIVVADWPLPDGRVIRLQLQPIFCFNCGKPNGYVPRDVMSFVSWMCMKCSEDHGELAANWKSSDEQFWADVAFEMQARFGHVLTPAELVVLADQGRLGIALEKLEKESPYTVWRL